MMKRYSSGKRASGERATLVTGRLRAPLLRVVTDCVDFLKTDIPEFVFRVPGRKEIVDELVDRYELGEPSALTTFVGVEANDAASLFKKYLMETNTPIFLKSQAQQLVRAATKVDMTQPAEPSKTERRRMAKFNKSLRVLTRTLSSTSAATLAKVFNFLRSVAADKDHTKMSVHALAICFAPVFFLPHFSAQEATAKIHVAIFVTEMLISRADALFPMYRRIVIDDDRIGGRGGGDTGTSGLAQRVSISRRQQQVLLEGIPRRRATVNAATFEHQHGADALKGVSSVRTAQRVARPSRPEDPVGSQASCEEEDSSTESTTDQALSLTESRRRLYTRSVDARGRPDRVDHTRTSWLHELSPFRSSEIRDLHERVSRKRMSARPRPLFELDEELSPERIHDDGEGVDNDEEGERDEEDRHSP
ncbi:Rho GTPase-activating protein 24 [Hondaea fermentalgiana]|uniref:Rho GTPase-activating protein 24 n=1 Tax=Hondaea fermentalgiana TaxID=2315210 RepID=A0A2R5GKH8_9STRA|nr:Rho GTPase-activating protein 24 [Hondaea fermentalgiana]|eukprot:GBG31380.1 Rho GTPase-activating protein 24 [Hondaea fermentalgiana]